MEDDFPSRIHPESNTGYQNYFGRPRLGIVAREIEIV
jgi:hypothetical protein